MKTAATAKALVIGASENPDRYSNMAILRLTKHGYPVEAIGLKAGKVENTIIKTGFPDLSDIDTVTLYVNPQRQEQFKAYIISLKPRRVIFNPGTENPSFASELAGNGIEPIEACTLVLLSTGGY